MHEKYKMYNHTTGAVIYTTKQFIQQWVNLGFEVIPNNIVIFPIRKVA